MKKWILSLLVFLLVLVVTAFIGFYFATFLIGPHSGILSPELFLPIGLLILILVIGIPAWLSYKTFKRYK